MALDPFHAFSQSYYYGELRRIFDGINETNGYSVAEDI